MSFYIITTFMVLFEKENRNQSIEDRTSSNTDPFLLKKKSDKEGKRHEEKQTLLRHHYRLLRFFFFFTLIRNDEVLWNELCTTGDVNRGSTNLTPFSAPQ